jgi:hypothetical protein
MDLARFVAPFFIDASFFVVGVPFSLVMYPY